MRIGIIGNGVVGSATARTYLEHCDEVRIYDTDGMRCTHSETQVWDCDIIFVCLPEQAILADRGSYFATLPDARRSRNFVLKSTVPIGTTRRLAKQYGLLNLVHSPEFLTARCSFTDAQCPTRNIIGCPGGKNMMNKAYTILSALYDQRFPGIKTHYMSSDESEAVKLIVNSFFAVKVAYFNEVRALCDKLQLDWETVRAGVLSDGRIAHAHTAVPGPDGKRGFGGKCLPKDLEHLIGALADAECSYAICRAAKNRNEMYDRPESN